MQLPAVHYLAVLAGGVLICMLGGLWYAPVLFAKKWMALMGKTDEDMKAAAATSSMPIPLMYLSAFLCGLLSAWVLAIALYHFINPSPLRGSLVGARCRLG